MWADRIDHAEYLSMIIKTNIFFIMRAPPIAYVSNIYALPFTPIAWICSIALIILCTIVVAKTKSICSDRFERTDRLNLSDYLLFAIASVCQKSSEIPTKFMSTRISMVSWRFSLDCLRNMLLIAIVSVFLFPRLIIHLHFVHGEYCGITSIHNQIDSHCIWFAKPGYWHRSRWYTVPSILVPTGDWTVEKTAFWNENWTAERT